MTINDLEIGMEVQCVKLHQEAPFGRVGFRQVGHIGLVSSIFPFHSVIYVTHIESAREGYVQHTSAFFADELELYVPQMTTIPNLSLEDIASDPKLKSAISSLKKSLDLT